MSTPGADMPPRSPWLQAAAIAGAFLGGGAFGTWLPAVLAPESWVATFAGMFAFPLAFIAGMQFWLGLALVLAVWRRLRHGPRQPGPHEVPSGSIAFVPTSAALLTAAGIVVALCGSRIGALATVGLYAVLGLAYGTLCWQLARLGYLPFPTE
jgi:hypothetical protein